jgi:hypothetical protein
MFQKEGEKPEFDFVPPEREKDISVLAEKILDFRLGKVERRVGRFPGDPNRNLRFVALEQETEIEHPTLRGLFNTKSCERCGCRWTNSCRVYQQPFCVPDVLLNGAETDRPIPEEVADSSWGS